MYLIPYQAPVGPGMSVTDIQIPPGLLEPFELLAIKNVPLAPIPMSVGLNGKLFAKFIVVNRGGLVPVNPLKTVAATFKLGADG